MGAFLRKWFYRVAAAQFLITAVTGIALYFRPLDERAGAFSHSVKEWLVMIHNGEWITELLIGNRYVSGVVVGATLATLTVRFAWRVLRGRDRRPALVNDEASR